jgi:predicted ferric reductase
MIFTSGQFAFFSFKSLLVKSESHPFSISSSPNDNNLKITVKNLGDYTGRLFNLKIGDFVMVDGPYGNFSYKKAKKQNQIWIAGGIGITPFYSMAQSLESGYKVDLYYSVKENLEAVYAKELIELTKKNPSFRFKLWNTTERGYVNGRVVTDLSSGLKDKEIFLCGPSVFM